MDLQEKVHLKMVRGIAWESVPVVQINYCVDSKGKYGNKINCHQIQSIDIRRKLMKAKEIVKFRASWHPKNNEGFIEFVDENGKKGSWRGSNAAEFNALLSILNTSRNPFITEKGWVSTGASETDD